MGNNLLRIVLGTDAKPMEKGLSKAKSDIKAFGMELGATKMGIAAVAGGAVAVSAAVGAAAVKGLKAWSVQEEAITGLNAALAATGQASFGLSGKLQAAAGEIQALTTNGDEAVLEMMKIGTAAGIPADKLDEAVRAAIGFRDTIGVGVNESLKSMGKAAQGVKAETAALGIALGKNVTPAEQLAAMLEKGNNLFGVSVERAESFNGIVTRINNVVGDLWEDVGLFVDGLIDANGSAKSLLGSLSNISAWTRDNAREWGLTFRLFFMSIGDMLDKYVIAPVSTIWTYVQDGIASFSANIMLFFTWIGENWRKVWDGLLPITGAFVDVIATNFENLFDSVYEWMASGFTTPISFKFDDSAIKNVKQALGINKLELAAGPGSLTERLINAYDEADRRAAERGAKLTAAEQERLARMTERTMGSADAAGATSASASKDAAPSGATAKQTMQASSVAAMTAGSTEAYSVVTKALQARDMAKDKAAQETARNTKQMAAGIQVIANNILGVAAL